MNTPILLATFATCVLGGVTITNNIADPGLSRWADPTARLQVEPLRVKQTPEPVRRKPWSGIYRAPKEEILPPGVARTP